MELLQSYPYLMSGLAGLLILGILARLGPVSVRRFALAGAAMALPCAFQTWLDAPAYWTPVRWFTLKGVGLEDVLCAYTLPGLACLLAAWPLSRTLGPPRPWSERPRRYLVIVAAGLGSRLILHALAVPVGAALVGSTAILAAVMLILQPARWPLAVAGAFLFTPFYFLLVKAVFLLAPGYPGQWNQAALWGPAPGGVPAEEWLWSLGLGIAWPLATAYVCQDQTSPRKEAA